jgi:murein DD-endopeptidase MepM/ murein hydrolase activator NlpD
VPVVVLRFLALGALAAMLAVVAIPAPASASADALPYLPPVAPTDGVIVEHFRPPPTPYGPGNRGIDYMTRPGAPVVAPAAGVVRFAGPVAGRLVVTVLHPDGLRSSDTGLAAVAVVIGQHVARGQVVGWAGPTLHFGVRRPDGTYLDPEALFAARPAARLVPGPDDGAAPLPAAPATRAREPPAWSARPRPAGFDAAAATAAFVAQRGASRRAGWLPAGWLRRLVPRPEPSGRPRAGPDPP